MLKITIDMSIAAKNIEFINKHLSIVCKVKYCCLSIVYKLLIIIENSLLFGTNIIIIKQYKCFQYNCFKYEFL